MKEVLLPQIIIAVDIIPAAVVPSWGSLRALWTEVRVVGDVRGGGLGVARNFHVEEELRPKRVRGSSFHIIIT